MERTKEMQDFLDGFTQTAFGRTSKDHVCIICGSGLISYCDFKDKLSYKEFEISHMCQKCQDSVFGQIVKEQ